MSLSRREFIKSIGRFAILGGTAAGLWSLIKSDKKIDHTCYNQGICNGCNRITDCRLPQALSYKEAKKNA